MSFLAAAATSAPARARLHRRTRAGGLFRLGFSALLAGALALSGSVVLPGTAVAAGFATGDEYLPPSETVTPPDTSDCPQQKLPPPPVDLSEEPAPGETSPAPLPVPTPAPGGDGLAECGFVLPDGAEDLPSDISAAAWMVADLDSGEVLGAKDPHGRYRPASTLKLLTALTMLTELPDLDAVVTGTQEDANQEGSRVGIGPGGKYTVRQLLLFMMMGSGNDTAFALARTNGGFDKTVADMNGIAADLGATDTRAVTVSGLDGPGQMTSVYDLALITRAAMQHPEFPELVSTKTSMVPGFGEYEKFGIANDNQLLHSYEGALGGKTGFTDDAGNTYMGMAERDGRRLVVTMLGGTQQPRRQWMQAASLLDWGFGLSGSTSAVGSVLSLPEIAEQAGTAESTADSTEVETTGSVAVAGTETDTAEPVSSASGTKEPAPGSPAVAQTYETVSTAGSLSGVIWFGGILVVLGLLIWVYLARTKDRRPPPRPRPGHRR
ncbi:penicillin-binding protein [Nakamurella silvestris]|nr:penicillin-binding protein [Nakamurella silvestris]